MFGSHKNLVAQLGWLVYWVACQGYVKFVVGVLVASGKGVIRCGIIECTIMAPNLLLLEGVHSESSQPASWWWLLATSHWLLWVLLLLRRWRRWCSLGGLWL